eukprot:evm.model.scf_117.3 EVM.evm.TU.scf_117.3   scf_117:21201-26482(+)
MESKEVGERNQPPEALRRQSQRGIRETGRRLIDNYFKAVRLCACSADPGTLQATVAAIGKIDVLKCKPEFQHWAHSVWSQIVHTAATIACSSVSRGPQGPQAADQLLAALLEDGLVSRQLVGPSVVAVMDGHMSQSGAEKVLSVAAEWFDQADGAGPPPPVRALKHIITACHSIGDSDLLMGSWDMLVGPAVKSLGWIPRSVSSAFLVAAFDFDARGDRRVAITEVVQHGRHTIKALAALAAAGNDVLDGPLLVAEDLIRMVRKAQKKDDVDLLLNSALGCRRGQTLRQTAGLRPETDVQELLWKGQLPMVPWTTRFGTPVLEASIAAYMRLGSEHVAHEMATAVTNSKRSVRPLMEYASAMASAGNLQAVARVVEHLKRKGRVLNTRSALQLITAMSMTPFKSSDGHVGPSAVKTWLSLVKVSPTAWESVFQAMVRAGDRGELVMSYLPVALNEPCSVAGLVRGRGPARKAAARVKIIMSALKAIGAIDGLNGQQRLLLFKKAWLIGRKRLGPSIDATTLDRIMASAIWATMQGPQAASDVLSGHATQLILVCLRLGLVPSDKTERALLQLCKMAEEESGGALKCFSGRLLDTMGIRAQEVFDMAERDAAGSSSAIPASDIRDGRIEEGVLATAAGALRASILRKCFADVRLIIERGPTWELKALVASAGHTVQRTALFQSF